MKKYFLPVLFFALTCFSLPSNADEYADLIKQGMGALREDSLFKAEPLFLEAINMKPSDNASAVLYQYVGEIRTRQKRHNEALEAFNAGLEINPASQTLFKESSKASEDIAKFRELRNRLSQTKPF